MTHLFCLLLLLLCGTFLLICQGELFPYVLRMGSHNPTKYKSIMRAWHLSSYCNFILGCVWISIRQTSQLPSFSLILFFCIIMQFYQIQRTAIDRNYGAVLIFTVGPSLVSLLSNFVFWSLSCLDWFLDSAILFCVLLWH